MPDYIPTREADLLTFAQNYSATLTVQYAAYGLILSDATNLATLVSTFATSFAAATDPATRTKARILQKDQDKENVIVQIRSLSNRIQANPGVTAIQKAEIGLPIRDRVPTSILAPVTKPVLSLLGISGTQQMVGIADETTRTSRAKPQGVVGCEIWAFLGDNPPADLSGWISKGIATRSTFTLNYAGEDSGKVVTLRARWFNPRGEFGPLSEPITARIAGGLSAAA